MLKAGGTELTIVPEIQRHKYAKTFWNVAFSSFSTLVNSPLTAIFRPPPPPPESTNEGHIQNAYAPYVAPITERLVREETLPVLQCILDEMVTLGRCKLNSVLEYFHTDESSDKVVRWAGPMKRAASRLLASDTISRTAALHRSPEANQIPSMLLDYRNASPIEVEVILSEVVRMARERNVPVPVRFH